MKTLNVLDVPEDCAALHLPVRGLYADLDVGAGSVSMPDEFLAEDPLQQAKVLQDWVRALEVERRRALAKAFRRMSAPMKAVPVDERISAFRDSCALSGIDFPPDLAVMLQYE